MLTLHQRSGSMASASQGSSHNVGYASFTRISALSESGGRPAHVRHLAICPRYEFSEAKGFVTVNRLWNHALEPGAHPPLDLLPFLRYLPGSWKEVCRQARRLQRQLYFGVLDECQTRLQHGQETGCFIERELQNQRGSRIDGVGLIPFIVLNNQD